MTGPQFFETRMGRQFYEGTMTRLVEAIDRFTDAQAQAALRFNDQNLADLAFMDNMDNPTLKEELVKRVQLIEQLRGHRDALLDQLVINHPPSPDTVSCEVANET